MIKLTTISIKLRLLSTASLALSIIISSGCNEKRVKETGESKDFQSYSMKHSQRFRLERNDSCTKVTILNPWQGASNVTQTYYLVQRGKRIILPAEAVSKVIEVPVRNLICTSTTHLAMISALGEEESVSGFSGTNYIYELKLTELVKSGNIKNVGEEAGLNYESIISLKPEIIIIYGVDSESVGYSDRFHDAGIKTVFNADFLEEDPLGKAEWIRLFGSLFCKEKMADSIYSVIENSYFATKENIERKLVSKPTVLLGLPFRDTWYVSPGNSYAAKLINDAGGRYLWSDTESSVTMPLSLENVYVKSINADYWLNIGGVRTAAEIKSIDVRLSSLPCFKNGNMYNNNNRISETGGNDYWEGGILNPHIILKDIASILHPEIFPDHQLTYYTRIQ